MDLDLQEVGGSGVDQTASSEDCEYGAEHKRNYDEFASDEDDNGNDKVSPWIYDHEGFQISNPAWSRKPVKSKVTPAAALQYREDCYYRSHWDIFTAEFEKKATGRVGPNNSRTLLDPPFLPYWHQVSTVAAPHFESREVEIAIFTHFFEFLEDRVHDA
jgi:hypothetical protein